MLVGGGVATTSYVPGTASPTEYVPSATVVPVVGAPPASAAASEKATTTPAWGWPAPSVTTPWMVIDEPSADVFCTTYSTGAASCTQPPTSKRANVNQPREDAIEDPKHLARIYSPPAIGSPH